MTSASVRGWRPHAFLAGSAHTMPPAQDLAQMSPQGARSGSDTAERSGTFRRPRESERAMRVHSSSGRTPTHRDGHSTPKDMVEQLQTVLDTIADGVAVSNKDGRIVQANRAFRELLAVDRVL